MVIKNQNDGRKDDRTAAADKDTLFLSLEFSQRFKTQRWRIEAKHMQIRKVKRQEKEGTCLNRHVKSQANNRLPEPTGRRHMATAQYHVHTK